MSKTTVTIPEAHGKAIHGRMESIKHYQHMMNTTIPMTIQVLVGEDKRHVDAVLASLNMNPDDYENYDLVRQDDNWQLSLTPKAQSNPDNTQQEG